MISLLHVADLQTLWSGHSAASQLARRLSRHRFEQTVLGIGVEPLSGREAPEHVVRHRLRLLPGPVSLSSSSILPHVSMGRDDNTNPVIHAWGITAALRAAGPAIQLKVPMVVSLMSSAVTPFQIKKMRALAQTANVSYACATEQIKRVLYEGGVPGDRCVLIRPAVDYALINEAPQLLDPANLGRPDDGFLLLLNANITPGDETAFLGAMILALVDTDVQLAVHKGSSAIARIEHLVNCSYRPGTVTFIEKHHPFEACVAVADGLLLGPSEHIDASAIPWAMAARTLVVAAAGYDTSEFISHKQNGLLYNGKNLEHRIPELTRVLRERHGRTSLLEAASAQAYEVFGLKRQSDDFARLYHNMVEGRAPSDGIMDAALVA